MDDISDELEEKEIASCQLDSNFHVGERLNPFLRVSIGFWTSNLFMFGKDIVVGKN